MASALIYYDRVTYDSYEQLYGVLKAIPNFWDSHDDSERTLTKGGITITVTATQAKGVSGYGRSFSVTFDGQNTNVIAATQNALIFNAEEGGQYQGVAIGTGSNGAWGAAKSNTNTSAISDVLGPNLTATSHTESPSTSSTNTQIIDLMSFYGDYVFDDIRRFYAMPADMKAHDGKITMPNGEKYVKVGGLALRYTE